MKLLCHNLRHTLPHEKKLSVEYPQSCSHRQFLLNTCILSNNDIERYQKLPNSNNKFYTFFRRDGPVTVRQYVLLGPFDGLGTSASSAFVRRVDGVMGGGDPCSAGRDDLCSACQTGGRQRVRAVGRRRRPAPSQQWSACSRKAGRMPVPRPSYV